MFFHTLEGWLYTLHLLDPNLIPRRYLDQWLTLTAEVRGCLFDSLTSHGKDPMILIEATIEILLLSDSCNLVLNLPSFASDLEDKSRTKLTCFLPPSLPLPRHQNLLSTRKFFQSIELHLRRPQELCDLGDLASGTERGLLRVERKITAQPGRFRGVGVISSAIYSFRGLMALAPVHVFSMGS